MHESDEILYHRYLSRGSEDDLRLLLERHRESLTLFIHSIVHDLDDAEELMMDAFAVVASKSNPFIGHSSFKTWLFSIGKKLALEHLRKRRIKAEPMGEAAVEHFTPDLALLREERSRQLYLGLSELKTEYRQALYLLYFEGMSHAEAGRVMGKSRRQLYNLAERGRKALKEALERMGYDHADY